MIGGREAALLALNEILYNGKYSNIAVKDMLGKCRGMDKTEKAFFTNLVYGVISHHYTLEYVISKYSAIKLKKLARYVKIILEIGMYQLIYLDKIPQSAAVNECVKLSKKYCKKGSDRFINGVLRGFCRDGCRFDTTDVPLNVKYSFSEDMTKMMLAQFGDTFTEQLMDALNTPPEIILRPNTMKTTADKLSQLLADTGVNNKLTDNGMIVCEGFDIATCKPYLDGYFTPQDRGAYTASVVLAPQSGERIIDMCSAPGGKTTHIAELMQDKGEVLAFDIHPHKIDLIKNTASRLGLQSITAAIGDATVFDKNLSASADRVLCDVPCSGWGIIRRKPDIKLSHTDLDELYGIQSRILNNGAEYVKDGGCLVYSTCTVNRKENEETVSDFLDNHKGFVKTYEKTFYPHTDGCDGFFICRLDKK